MKRFGSIVAGLCLLVLAAPVATASSEVEQTGMIYVGLGVDDGKVRENPSADAKIVGHVPHGMRVVYRKTMSDGSKVVWYRVEPPGGSAGWIAASETSATRPNPPAGVKPVSKGTASGLTVKTDTAITAAARGLDSRAGSATRQDDQKSLQQFAAFEKHVNGHFDDPEDAQGVYPATTTGRRKQMAAEFRGGGK